MQSKHLKSLLKLFLYINKLWSLFFLMYYFIGYYSFFAFLNTLNFYVKRITSLIHNMRLKWYHTKTLILYKTCRQSFFIRRNIIILKFLYYDNKTMTILKTDLNCFLKGTYLIGILWQGPIATKKTAK